MSADREQEGWRPQAHYEARMGYRLEMLKATFETGKDALNTLILISGGAVIVLLGFIGTLVKDGKLPSAASGLAMALIAFGVAALLGGLAHAARYLAQSLHFQSIEPENRRKAAQGDLLGRLAVVLSLLGFITFGGGVVLAAFAVFRLIG